MKDTGERMIEEYHAGKLIWGEHYSRYFLASQFVKGKIVLDGSCGSGYGTYFLAKYGKAKLVYGIDISGEAIEYAKSHFDRKNIKFLEENLEKTSLPDKCIDVYVSFETIEHVKNYKKFLLDVKRVLKGDGVLVLSTPNSGSYPQGNPFHTKEFNADELAELLRGLFRNIWVLYQDNWVASSIFNKKRLSNFRFGAPEELSVNKIKSETSDKSPYFLVCASDRKLGEIKESSVLFPFPLELSGINLDSVSKLLEALSKNAAEISRLKELLNEKDSELKFIYNSRGWKLIKILRKAKNLTREK